MQQKEKQLCLFVCLFILQLSKAHLNFLIGGAKINCHHPVVISRIFFSAQAPENANVVFSVFALTRTNGATVTLAMMIGCGMVEKLLRRNICLSGLCTLVTLAIHWIEKRGDTALAHLNVTETYSLTTWSHLGIIFFPSNRNVQF